MNTTIYNGTIGLCTQPKKMMFFTNSANDTGEAPYDGSGTDTWTTVESFNGDAGHAWSNPVGLIYGLDWMILLTDSGNIFNLHDVGASIRWSIVNTTTIPNTDSTINGGAIGVPQLVLSHGAVFMGPAVGQYLEQKNRPVPTDRRHLRFPIPLDVGAFLSSGSPATPGVLGLLAQSEVGPCQYWATLWWDWTRDIHGNILS